MSRKTAQGSPIPVNVTPTPGGCSMGGTRGPFCQLQPAWLRLQEKTLPKSHPFKQKDPAWRNSTCLETCWGKPQQQTCREWSWQSQEHQRGCRPSLCPAEKPFLRYQTLSNFIISFGAALQEATSRLQISFFILLLAGAKPSKLQLRFGEGRKRLQLLNCWGKRISFQVA